MSKRTICLLHIAIWVVLFISPMPFMRRENHSFFLQFMLHSLVPLTTMFVFYVNYFWLTPHYFVKGEKRYYWGINVLLIVVLGVACHYWLSYLHALFGDSGLERTTPLSDLVIFIMRDIFQLAIAATIATTIQLSMRWQHSEAARMEAEVARAEAEVKNLRWQMNPHFLLNTLNNIYALTAIDTQRAQQAIQELSQLMRYVLYDNQLPHVLLTDEVKFMENYVALMKIRLPKSVDVQLHAHIPDASSQITIVPLVSISLVENAFKHGVSPTRPSFIHIDIQANQQAIVCDIRNTNFPKSEKDRSGHGIGLELVRKRLELAYPGQYTWEHGVSDDGRVYYSRIELRPPFPGENEIKRLK